jgi:hypothetical protein
MSRTSRYDVAERDEIPFDYIPRGVVVTTVAEAEAEVDAITQLLHTNMWDVSS